MAYFLLLISQKTDSKTEGKFSFHCSPHLKENLEVDKEMLTFELFSMYQRLLNSTRLKFNGLIRRPVSNIDVETKLFYETSKHDKTFKLSIHYADGKDITVTLYWYHPRHVLKKMEGYLKVGIPNYTPMVLDGKLKEKAESDYNVSFILIKFLYDGASETLSR